MAKEKQQVIQKNVQIYEGPPKLQLPETQALRYLDGGIEHWKEEKKAGNPTADFYLDAFHVIRETLFGDVKPLPKGK